MLMMMIFFLGSHTSSRWLILGLFCFHTLFGHVVHAESQSSSPLEPATICPDYRYFNAQDPTAFKLGAPPGCSCFQGLSGLGCAYCQDDSACKKQSRTATCNEGLTFEIGDTHKALYCRLTSLWNSIYGNGQLSIFFDVATRSGNLTLYQFDDTGVDGVRAMDCHLNDCDLEPGATRTTCKSVTCVCEQQCQNRWLEEFQSMVTGIHNSHAEVILGAPGDSGHNIPNQRKITLKMDGVNAPLTLDAFCSGRTCQEPTPEHPDWMDSVDNTDALSQASDAVPVSVESEETSFSQRSWQGRTCTVASVLVGMAVAVYLV